MFERSGDRTGAKWSNLIEKTSYEHDIGIKKGKVETRMEPDTHRILEPYRNNELDISSRKRMVNGSKNRLANNNPLLGEGFGEIDDRKNIARNRHVKTIRDFENNKLWWNRETYDMVEKLKHSVDYNSVKDGVVADEYIDPKLAAKIEKMKEGQKIHEANRDFGALYGGNPKP